MRPLIIALAAIGFALGNAHAQTTEIVTTPSTGAENVSIKIDLADKCRNGLCRTARQLEKSVQSAISRVAVAVRSNKGCGCGCADCNCGGLKARARKAVRGVCGRARTVVGRLRNR